MHDIEVSRVQILFWHNGRRDEQSNLSTQSKEKLTHKKYSHNETILHLAKLKLKYYVSNILHHPKWPGDLYDVHIPEVKTVVSDRGCILMLDWYSHWKAHIDALAEIRKHHHRMRSKELAHLIMEMMIKIKSTHPKSTTNHLISSLLMLDRLKLALEIDQRVEITQ